MINMSYNGKVSNTFRFVNHFALDDPKIGLIKSVSHWSSLRDVDNYK